MNEIINLRQFKKKKARAAKEQHAEQNRILFGRTKIEKDFAQRDSDKAERFLSLNQLDKAGNPKEDS